MFIKSNTQSDLIRHEELDGKDHLVVPVVALVEGVITSGNVGIPQLALASEFGKFSEGWNGRPVVIDHPVMNGESVSANNPTIIETSVVGSLFNTTIDGKKLITEAWIDIDKANKIGGVVAETVERLENGEMVEVSTGLFADTKPSEGVFEGEKFNGIWESVVPDHLAILSSGIGACSIADGCGAPRINCEGCNGDCRMKNSGEELDIENPEVVKAHRKLIPDFLTRLFTNKPQSEMSHGDVREALQSAIANEGRDGHIIEVFNERFIFHDWMSMKNFQRSFSINDDGGISLGEELEEVRMETDFVPVIVNEESEMEKEKLVGDLIANESTKFEEGDREWLLSLEDGQLEKLAPELAETPSGSDAGHTPEDTINANAAPPAEAPATVEEFISAAPDKIGEVLSNGVRLHDEQRARLTEGILANSEGVYTQAELDKLDFVSLEKLAKVAKVEDYSGRGNPVPVTNTSEGNAAPAAPLVFETKSA